MPNIDRQNAIELLRFVIGEEMTRHNQAIIARLIRVIFRSKE